MSYIFLQEQAGESLAECFSDIPAYVLSRLNLTDKKICSPGNGTEFSRSSQSGTMLKPLTENRGADSPISSVAGSHAKTSAQPGKARALKASKADYGPRWPGSFARFNRHSSLWKTAQCSLFGGLTEFSETWPRWGMMRDGECSALPTPSGLVELRAWIISASASGSLEKIPTPNVFDAIPDFGNRKDNNSEDGGRHGVSLRHLVKTFRFPTLHGFSKDGLSNGPSGNELGRAVNRMETPTVQDGINRNPSKNFRLTKTGRARHLNAKGVESQERLAQQVKRMPTVTGQDSKNNGAPSQMERNSKPLNAEVGGALNPEWVEWLMNWPEGWTCLSPISHIEYLQWLMETQAHDEEAGKHEVLRVLRIGNVAEEIREATGRHVSLFEATVLFAYVCKHKDRFDKARILLACAKVFKREMRGVRASASATSASSRPRHKKQRARKHSNFMQVLPRLLAHYSKATWMGYRREVGVPRVAVVVANRVDRLGALGDGQVPAVVRLAWETLTK